MQMPSDMFQSLTLHRHAAGSYDSNGRWVDGAVSDVVITACVQPASAREMMHFEEGERTKATISIWSPDEIRTIDEVAGHVADYLDWDGSEWEVDSVERYTITPELKHYHALAQKRQKKAAGGPIP